MTVFHIISLWVLAAWLILGAIGAVFLIGKERKPWTAGQAVFGLIVNGFFATVLITLAIWGGSA
jgi:hypothetical protein